MDAVGADEEIAALARAVGEKDADLRRVLLDPDDTRPGVIARGRQRILERAIDPVPGAVHRRHDALVNDGAAAVEADARVDPDARRRIEPDADPPHDGEKIFARADAGAAPRQILEAALEDGDLPAGAAQQVGGQQAADRAADDERAAGLHLALPIRRSSALRRIWRAGSDPSSGRDMRCLIFQPSAVRTRSQRFEPTRNGRKPLPLP